MSQNLKWKTKTTEGERPLPDERVCKDKHQEAESVLPVSGGTILIRMNVLDSNASWFSLGEK